MTASVEGRGPSIVATDMTSRSRRWSMAGFVTCAKRWRRYVESGRARPARGAMAESSPIEYTGSCPVWASGRNIAFRSSRVYPWRTWRASRASTGAGTGAPGSRATVLSSTHAPYGRRAASSRRRSAPVRKPWSGSTVRMPPGPRRPRRTVTPSGRGTAPASEATATSPSPHTATRSGRSPFRSRLAPQLRPSEKHSAAGPSHGSLSSAPYRWKSRTSGSRRGSFCQAGGTSSETASGRSLPRSRTRTSSALSSRAESDPVRSSDGASAGSAPSACSRASIQATFPSMVLISPLWQRRRNGCTRAQLGSVLVEKRWWKIANETAKSGSSRSG